MQERSVGFGGGYVLELPMRFDTLCDVKSPLGEKIMQMLLRSSSK